MTENTGIIVDELITLLKGNFERLKSVLKGKKIGILVSGGLDSSIIAHLSHLFLDNPVHLSLAGKDSQDGPYLIILEKYLGKNIKRVSPETFSETDIKKIKQLLIKNNIEANLMQMSLALGFYLLGKEGNVLGLDCLLTGQGADEIFGGYTRYKNYEGDLKDFLKEDYESVGSIDYKRDTAVLNHFNIDLINPYEDKLFLEYALSISPELKLYKKDDAIIEKYILRLMAQKLGLPEEIIWRPKKAFQYSSRIQKILAAYLGIKT
jgi:asparagine synthase (glutamine-hydrolysing)